MYLANNENVQFLLDNNDKYLQPLRKAGMKIIISILGNHDEAGVAQLSDMGARNSPGNWQPTAVPIIWTASLSMMNIRTHQTFQTHGLQDHQPMRVHD